MFDERYRGEELTCRNCGKRAPWLDGYFTCEICGSYMSDDCKWWQPESDSLLTAARARFLRLGSEENWR